MATNTFFPSTEADQILWLGHFSSRLPELGAICGIAESEITASQSDLSYYTWLLQFWHPAAQRHAKEATLYKQLMVGGGDASGNRPQAASIPEPPSAPAPGLQKRLFALIARIKAAAAYTEAIGHDLAIIPTSARWIIQAPITV